MRISAFALITLLLAQPVMAETVGTVNGVPITSEMLQGYIKQLPPYVRSQPELLEQAITEQAVNDTLVLQAAKKAGVETSPKYIAKLAALKAELAREIYVREQIEKNLTEDRLRAAYAEQYKAGVEEVKARHILVPDEATAKEVVAKLDKGGKFADLAIQYSKDGSGPNGGDLGYFTRDAMVKPFADAAFALKKGEYTKTPVKSQFGYHIILLEDRRRKEAPKFEEVKSELRQKLAVGQIQALLEGLRKNASINIDKNKVKALKID